MFIDGNLYNLLFNRALVSQERHLVGKQCGREARAGRLGSGESQGQGCKGDGAPASDTSESSNFSALLNTGPCMSRGCGQM